MIRANSHFPLVENETTCSNFIFCVDALNGTPGIQSAAVHLETEDADITYKETDITVAEIIEIIEKLDFKVSLSSNTDEKLPVSSNGNHRWLLIFWLCLLTVEKPSMTLLQKLILRRTMFSL